METETLVMMNTNRRRMVLKPLSPALLKNKEQNSTNNTNERIPVSFLDYRSFFTYYIPVNLGNILNNLLLP